MLQLVGTLTLTAESKVDTSPSNKKLFVFDLKTKSNNGDMKVNRFKVSLKILCKKLWNSKFDIFFGKQSGV